MFVQLNAGYLRRRQAPFLGSLAAHCLFLAWLLHSPKPIFVAPFSVVGGQSGSSITYVYHPNKAGTAEVTARPRRQLTFKPAGPAEARRRRPAPEAETPTEAASRPETGPLAGSPQGTLLTGSYTGEEVRPALRISGSEPRIPQADLGGIEGNVVIELTIDERGNITEKNVIQSLAPAIDGRVLAALEDWRFLPAAGATFSDAGAGRCR